MHDVSLRQDLINYMSLFCLIMRIDGPNPIRPSVKRESKSKTGASGSFSDALEPESVSEAAPTIRLAGIGSLFALQEVPDPTTGRRRAAIARGDMLLDSLGEIQMGLLEGTIDKRGLKHLGVAVRSARAGTEDPALQAVLDEIEVRAAVELAKLEPVE
jgi:hypothetical protein